MFGETTAARPPAHALIHPRLDIDFDHLRRGHRFEQESKAMAAHASLIKASQPFQFVDDGQVRYMI